MLLLLLLLLSGTSPSMDRGDRWLHVTVILFSWKDSPPGVPEISPSCFSLFASTWKQQLPKRQHRRPYKETQAASAWPHTFDLFGELDPVRVGERPGLLVNVVDVQDLAHELDDGLGFVESCGWHWKETGGEQTLKSRWQLFFWGGLCRARKFTDNS